MTTPPSTDLPGVDGMSPADMHQFATDPPGHLRDLQDRYGDVFRSGPGQILVGHPELVQTLLARTNRDASADIDVLGDFRTPTDAQVAGWMRARRLASGAFREPGIIAHLGAVDRAVTAQLAAAAGTTFDPMTMAPDLFVHAALPICAPGAAPSIVPAAVAAARTFLDVMDGGFGMPPAERQARRDAAVAAKQALRSATDEVVAGSAAGCPHTVLEVTADLSPAVRSHVLHTVLAAASVVPGAALAWLIHELGTRPAEAAAIREEARALPVDLDGHDLATVAPYARGFAHEVLRLHPPTWLTGRGIGEAIELGGHRLPAQQFVSFSPYLLHRDPRWWDEPGEFRPRRWTDDRTPHAPHAFLPFGAGTRVCIATHLGTAILTLAALRLAADHVVEITEPEQVTARFGVPLQPVNLRVTLSGRSTRRARGCG